MSDTPESRYQILDRATHDLAEAASDKLWQSMQKGREGWQGTAISALVEDAILHMGKGANDIADVAAYMAMLSLKVDPRNPSRYDMEARQAVLNMAAAGPRNVARLLVVHGRRLQEALQSGQRWCNVENMDAGSATILEVVLGSIPLWKLESPQDMLRSSQPVAVYIERHDAERGTLQTRIALEDFLKSWMHVPDMPPEPSI